MQDTEARTSRQQVLFPTDDTVPPRTLEKLSKYIQITIDVESTIFILVYMLTHPELIENMEWWMLF